VDEQGKSVEPPPPGRISTIHVSQTPVQQLGAPRRASRLAIPHAFLHIGEFEKNDSPEGSIKAATNSIYRGTLNRARRSLTKRWTAASSVAGPSGFSSTYA
jgi:hypothetical protein